MARREVPVSLRRTIVEIELDGLNVTAFCRDHGVSSWYFYDLRRRHRALGALVLEPLSRAPHTVANKTPVWLENRIVEVRKRLDDFGADAGPASIHSELARDGLCPVPSESTIWRILRRGGFITPQPAKRPKRSGHRFVAERANELWQIDDTAWFLADGTEVKVINVIDDCSRLNVASIAVSSCTKQAVLDTLLNAGQACGFPERILSDNGTALRAAIDEL